jgi:hypothetical protein
LGTVTVAIKEPFTSVIRGVGLVVNAEPSQVTVTAVEEANPYPVIVMVVSTAPLIGALVNEAVTVWVVVAMFVPSCAVIV